MSDNGGTSSGVGFIGALTLLFVGLKLTHVLNWSWWWVLSPIWIGWGVVVLLIVIVALVSLRSDRQ